MVLLLRDMWDGAGTCPLSNKIDKDKELELFSLGFCVCNQAQGLVLPESCLPCISVCECSHNFPAKIHCPKFWDLEQTLLVNTTSFPEC